MKSKSADLLPRDDEGYFLSDDIAVINYKDKALDILDVLDDLLERHGLEFQPDYVIFSGFHESDGQRGMEQLLRRNPPPDALFAVNDPVALGSYEAIKQAGLRIPDDVAVVGFSNNPISAVVSPPLTTIEQPSYEMGKYAAEILIRLLKGDNETTKESPLVLNTRLIKRASA